MPCSSRTLAFGLLLATLLSPPVRADEWDADAPSDSTPKQQQEAEGVSCMRMCIEEGEDPMECNYYCIQVVENGTRPLRVACR